MTQPDEPPQRQQDDFPPSAALVWGGFLGATIVGVAALLLADFEWSWEYWGRSDGVFNRSEIGRNLVLSILAFAALFLGAWRSWTAHRQAKYAALQVDNANEQRKIALRGQQVERFQNGVQMLDNSSLAVRVAGIFTLKELALSDPEETYVIVQSLLCSFIREKCSIRTMIGANGCTQNNHHDIQEAINAFITLRGACMNWENLESDVGFTADLSDCDFSGVDFFTGDLSNTSFIGSSFNNTTFRHCHFDRTAINTCNMREAIFDNCTFVGTECELVDFRNAYFFRSHFIVCNFYKSILTGTNYNKCYANDTTFADCCISGGIFHFEGDSSIHFYDCWIEEGEAPPESASEEIKFEVRAIKKPEPIDHVFKGPTNVPTSES